MKNKCKKEQHSFQKAIEIGKFGEKITKCYLYTQPWAKQIVDVSNIPEFQNDDVDFIVNNNDGKQIRIEVKADLQSHKTGNLVYEESTSGHIGCFKKTTAHYIFYVIPKINTFYIINIAKMKEYINQNAKRLEKRYGGDASELYLLSINEIESTPVIKKKVIWTNNKSTKVKMG